MSESKIRDKGGAVNDAAPDSVDRIVLRRAENERLHGWVSALNARFDGMIRVTKSDVANFLVRQHQDDLSESEIKAIESELFDEVRWLNWALMKVRQAKKDGLSLSLSDLMANREAIQSRKDVPSKDRKQRRRRSVPPPADSTSGVPEVPDYESLEKG